VLTLFACPKPFVDPHIRTIQRNAILSWTLLNPRPEIILLGNEVGTSEICRELGLVHLQGLKTNRYGTPLVNDLFLAAAMTSANDFLCYVNADIILGSDFTHAFELVRGWPKPFLLSGGRWEMDVREEIRFSDPNWIGIFDVARSAKPFKFFGNDYFLYRRGLFEKMPPLALGRGWFDGWLFANARACGASVIDASLCVTAIHQSHDYAHARVADDAALWRTEEAKMNYRLAGVRRHWFLLEATHAYRRGKFRRIVGRKFAAQLRDFVAYRMGPLRQNLGLRSADLQWLKLFSPTNARS
jgi:hypothetical protein